jgi:FAD:protein FMN transferase
MSTEVFHRTIKAMNTRMDIVICEVCQSTADQVFRVIAAEARRIEYLLSKYNEEGICYRLVRQAWQEEVEFPEELWIIYEQCRRFWTLTHGLFDITAGSFASLIENAHQKGKTGYDFISTNPCNHSIKINLDGLEFDFGAIGKGYALESFKKILTENQIESAFISFGESSIMGVGHHPSGDCWKVAIEDPYHFGGPLYTFNIRGHSLSTSGNSIKNKEIQHHHIINPINNEYLTDLRTVSIQSSSAIEAEVLSTALFIADNENREKILSSFSVTDAIEINYATDSQMIKQLLLP